MNTQDSEGTTKARQSGCCCASKSSADINTQDASAIVNNDLPVQRLQVAGATCGGCVKSIEQALLSVTGVMDAQMDLASGIASIIGTVQPNDLIETLERAGFPAVVVN
ncbi:heavy metal-associated domain-containing protein [Dasania sp. GY-19]|uniref:Heavy metal-associated domain-containing protein n=1 Tax=Dasania phycosphaerae TaxID=2950436 RepID=A0A9J6RRS0_9GAMM|nr:heavy metal-associated domain-containing protein [Dasania phycosphaerae]MCZ0866773.1 heavy metal-associated domain-containing protein [Dasania phycosphaerae]